MSALSHKVPGCGGVFDGALSEMSDFDFGTQCLIGSENAFAQSCQRNGAVAESAVLFGGDISFIIPKRIEDADEGRALAGKVVKVEQFEAGHSGRSKRGLDVFLVAKGLQFSAGEEELMRKSGHAVFAKKVAKDFEILRFQVTGVFGNFSEVRVNAPLADF